MYRLFHVLSENLETIILILKWVQTQIQSIQMILSAARMIEISLCRLKLQTQKSLRVIRGVFVALKRCKRKDYRERIPSKRLY